MGKKEVRTPCRKCGARGTVAKDETDAKGRTITRRVPCTNCGGTKWVYV